MSQAVKIAAVARMEADAALVKLLAADPDDSTAPAIFNSTKSQAPLVYDCLTFRIEQSSVDRRFRPAVPGQVYTQGVEDFFLDLEGWTDSPDSAPLDAINARMDALFHFETFPTTAGPVFFCERVMRQTDLYDKTLNAWFSLSRYRLRLQRNS